MYDFGHTAETRILFSCVIDGHCIDLRMDILLFICFFFNRSIKMRRRLLRGRMFALGLLFMICSVLNVYSSSDIDTTTRAKSAPNDLSTISPKSDDAGSNDAQVAHAFTLEKPQSTTSRTKGLLYVQFNVMNFMLIELKLLMYSKMQHQQRHGREHID